MAEVLDRFRALAAAHDGIAVKGQKTPYTAVNGNMFAFIADDDTFCLRLPEPDRAAFEAEHGPSEVRQYGAVMRGYVRVPGGVVADVPRLEALFASSVAFARGLKPKPTRRKG